MRTDAGVMRAALILLIACGHDPQPVERPEAPRVVDAAEAATPIDGAVDSCTRVADVSPPNGFLAAARVVHLRIVSARAGATNNSDRCVALDLEVLDNLRGSGEAKGAHAWIVVKQSMIEHYTSRPAGAWWIIEQKLEPGEELIALCPAGPLMTTLVGSCGVAPAAALLTDARFARDREAAADKLDAALAATRAACKTLSGLAASYVWDKHGGKDPVVLDKIATVIEDKTCDPLFRNTLLMAAQGLTIHDDKALTRRLVLLEFRLLAQPEAAGLHDNLVGTYLPNDLGISSGMQKLSAADVFKGEPARRAEAVKALAAYQGSSDASKLRSWLK